MTELEQMECERDNALLELEKAQERIAELEQNQGPCPKCGTLPQCYCQASVPAMMKKKGEPCGGS